MADVNEEIKFNHTVESYFNFRKKNISAYGTLSFFISLILSIIICLFKTSEWKWYIVAINILPTIIGFSFATCALLMSLKMSEFYECNIKEETFNYKFSPFYIILSEITCYLAQQCTTLIYAYISDALNSDNIFSNAIGTFALSYSLIILIAFVLNIRLIIKLMHISKLNEK